MIQRGTVTALCGDRAEVKVSRISACDGCHKRNPGFLNPQTGVCHECTVFPTETVMTVSAKNTVGACVGERVMIETETGTVLRYAGIVFLLPLFLGVCFGIVGNLAVSSAAGGIVGGCVGLLLSFLFLRYVLEPRAKRKTEYSIKEIIR